MTRSRRRPLLTLGAVATFAALAACGADDGSTSPTSAATTTATTAGSAPPTTEATAPTTVVRPTTSTETSVTTATPVTTATTSPTRDGGYPSVITDEVVDNPAFDSLERDVIRRLTLAGLPGASLLVVQHGQLVEQEAWLTYDLDTRVPIASASKWLTAATIMTLVDEGVIALDAPISTYVPELEAVKSKVGAITMRQLLSFTSGLIADERVPCAEDPTVTMQDCARQFLAAGTVHPPGEAFRYGSQHMLVAGAIAEVVTGVPFAELFQQRIAVPLGMTRTLFFQIGDPSVRPVTHASPAGSGASTLGDYGRFLEMLYHDGVAPDGTRLLSHEAIVEMQTNQIEGARYVAASEFRKATEGPYGLGEWLDWTDADGNALVLSSDGKFGFRPWLDKANDLFGVYLIEDHGSGYVDGDPDAPADDAGKVHTSGLWVFEGSAEALGGGLPNTQYPDRQKG